LENSEEEEAKPKKFNALGAFNSAANVDGQGIDEAEIMKAAKEMFNKQKSAE